LDVSLVFSIRLRPEVGKCRSPQLSSASARATRRARDTAGAPSRGPPPALAWRPRPPCHSRGSHNLELKDVHSCRAGPPQVRVDCLLVETPANRRPAPWPGRGSRGPLPDASRRHPERRSRWLQAPPLELLPQNPRQRGRARWAGARDCWGLMALGGAISTTPCSTS